MRFYTATIKISGVTTGKTLLHITVPNAKHIELISSSVTGSAASSQQLECAWHKVASGSPTGTTITPSKHDVGDTACASTVVGNVTAEPTYTSAPAVQDGYSIQPSVGGWMYPLVPRTRDARLQIADGEAYGLRLLNTLTSIDLVCEMVFGEMG